MTKSGNISLNWRLMILKLSTTQPQTLYFIGFRSEVWYLNRYILNIPSFRNVLYSFVARYSHYWAFQQIILASISKRLNARGIKIIIFIISLQSGEWKENQYLHLIQEYKTVIPKYNLLHFFSILIPYIRHWYYSCRSRLK